MSTPGKPRLSGIPGPGRTSGIPTPGRSRSTSSATNHAEPAVDVEYMSRAFADAIKANDPAQHRGSRVSDVSTASLSPQSFNTHIQSSSRFVNARPSSSASSSSVTSFNHPKAVERTKTPISTRPPSRPPSRHSDVFGRSSSRSFEIGDKVRIESLGYEGTLRYIGEIEGKLGLWAGVELSGGFAGKGKNDGTVNGKQYFSCPASCGVFVATIKLSPPTVGYGAVQRPPSVASSRGGRATPTLSGRTTPSSVSITTVRASTSGGRVTPSTTGRTTPSFLNGRTTPGMTPAARVRLQPVSKPTTSVHSTSLGDKITAGSRASKYASMTAKQLTSRDIDPGSPPYRASEIPSPARSLPSPSHNSRTIPSPTRPPGSPFSTPKPGLGGRIPSVGGGLTPSKIRPSVSTPRPRIPSAIAMPPPASPISSSSRSVSLNDHVQQHDAINGVALTSELEVHGKALQEKVAVLTSGNSWSSRPDSATSVRSTATDERVLIEQLQSRVDALEYENERLRNLSASIEATSSDPPSQVESLQLERDEVANQVSLLQAELTVARNSITVQAAQIESLGRDYRTTLVQLDEQKSTSDIYSSELRSQLNEEVALARSLRESIDEQEILQRQTDVALKVKESDIAALELKLGRMQAELEDEKRELNAQIDELREAGQETIALYEERLSTADTQRYELECRNASLEAGNRPAARSPSPISGPRGIVATQIDNETLRDQVQHLQRKITTLEDIIEDAHVASEKEEAAIREKMKRLKEKEEGMKKELNEGRKEVERMFKSEASVRSRVEEIEEALRESTVALENARAEVEGLRAELANLDGLVASSSAGDLSSRVAEVAQRASTDRTRYNEQLAKLQDLLESSREVERQATERLNSLENVHPPANLSNLKEQIYELQIANDEKDNKLTMLVQALEERSSELESLKKKSHRDLPVNTTLHESLKPQSPSSKYDLSVAREEIMGLKHIVQELQKENLAAAQRIKLLESENQLLVSEAAQLRQEVQILEDNLDHSLTREEQAANDGPPISGSADTESLHNSLKEQRMRFETELEQLRKRLSDAEMKHARTAHDLNKEIGELEALVESKIYREDELEQELERVKDKLARHKKSSKTSTDIVDARRRVDSTSSSITSVEPVHQEVCEICERPGHDIFNCDLLKEDAPVAPRQSSAKPLDLFCEDCESHGHVAADCPHSLDVF